MEIRFAIERRKAFRHYRFRGRNIGHSCFSCRFAIGYFFFPFLIRFFDPLIKARDFTQGIAFSVNILFGYKPMNVSIRIL